MSPRRDARDTPVKRKVHRRWSVGLVVSGFAVLAFSGLVLGAHRADGRWDTLALVILGSGLIVWGGERLMKD